MTRKETTEIFSVMMLAWPNAEMFKGGVQKLKPTIDLWTACLNDVDFWTAQQAIIKLCRVRDFPPTIAAFREQVAEVNKELKQRIILFFNEIELMHSCGQSLQEIYDGLGGEYRQVIDMIGGPGKLICSQKNDGGTAPEWTWNWDLIRDAYIAYLSGNERKYLPDAIKTKEGK